MANFLKEHKIKNGPHLLFDAGNFCTAKGREQKVLSEYFMKGMGLLGYSAVLVGANDLKHGVSFIRGANEASRLPLVASYLLDDRKKPVFEDLLKIRYKNLNIAVIGLSDNVKLNRADATRYQVLDPGAALARLAGRIKKTKNTVVVLLADVKEASLEKILAAGPYIDIVICAEVHRYNERGERLKQAVVFSDTRQTKNVRGFSFGLGAKGVARHKGFSASLGKKYGKHKAMDKIFAAYDTALSAHQFKSPRPADAQKIFAGADACRSCHAREYDNWRKGPHKNAFEPLEKSGNQYNPQCLKCHTTGYERENGFWDIETSRDMAGVQCEQCHGSLQNHVKEEGELSLGSGGFGGMGGGKTTKRFKPYPVKFYICTRCHTDKWALPVKPEEAWKTIGHTKKQ
jgi:hypothetical protein